MCWCLKVNNFFKIYILKLVSNKTILNYDTLQGSEWYIVDPTSLHLSDLIDLWNYKIYTF